MRSLPIILLFLLSPFVLHAQQDSRADTGSPYSSIGPGLPVDLFSPTSMGMGIGGVSVYEAYLPNDKNPALWGLSRHTQGTLGMGFQNHQMSDSVESASFNQFTIDRFQLVLPVMRQRLGLSLGFFPVTRSSYDIFGQNTVSAPNGLEPNDMPLEYVNHIKGSGGINRMELGVGYRISNNFAVGYAGSLHLATLNREFTTVFSDPDMNPMLYMEESAGIATGHRFGFFARKGELFGSGDEIRFGASLNLPVRIETDREVTSFRNVRGQISTVNLTGEGADRGVMELPLEFNVGLTYYPSRFVSLSAEYMEQLWGDTEYSFNPTQEQYLVDRSKIGMGAQFHPYAREGQGGNFFSNFKYSAGVTYDTGHLMLEGTNIETLMFHGGIGILSLRTASSVDLGFYYGIRGTEMQNLVKENIWGIRLSLNLAELMFERSRFN